MKPALELKRIFGPQKREITGTVVSVTGQALKIRTSRGVIDARSVDATTYQAADEVLVRDSIVQGRITRTADVPVYDV